MDRRKLHFDDLSEAVKEFERLLDSGYSQLGNWSLAQMALHLRLTIDASVDGYPKWMSLFAPIRPILRTLALPRLLRGDSTKGIPTAPMFEPKSSTLEDEVEVQLLKESIERFRNHTGKFYPHPGFGLANLESLDPFHAAHCAHHLGFLVPATGQPNSATSHETA